MRITPLQVEASYSVASRVFDHEVTAEAGANELQTSYGLNINSARDFINDYRHMLQGKVFQRAMSALAIDYYLSRMVEERGPSAHEAAVKAVEKHIKYYEGIRKVNLNAMRAVLNRHKGYISAQPLLSVQEALFSAAVKKSLADSTAKRQARLAEAAKFPVKIKVTTETYLRNPDVVAEVLRRAAGKCERCQDPAPFIRKKDDTPYLEVHHKKQLSAGGEDTIDNAVALCPNCHRNQHYGATDA